MRAVDFFCGAGGFTHGLVLAGIDVIGGVDADSACQESYERNNQGAKFLEADIRTLTPLRLMSVFPKLANNDDRMIFVGCAPCQPFSQQRRGEKRHPDAGLLRDFGALVEQFRPGFVIVENVPGIASVAGASTFNRFRKAMERVGYSVAYGVVNAVDFGVPQSRRRLVLIASRVSKASLPDATHGPGRLPHKTVRDAISGLPELRAGEAVVDPPNHRASALSPLNFERMKHTPKDGGSRSSWPSRLVLDCHKGGYTGHPDVYGRLKWDEPAPTLTGRCYSLSNGRYGHPEQDRALSLREAAALQSFPVDYEFSGNMRQVALQIGNAVPPLLAFALGEHVLGTKSRE